MAPSCVSGGQGEHIRCAGGLWSAVIPGTMGQSSGAGSAARHWPGRLSGERLRVTIVFE